MESFGTDNTQYDPSQAITIRQRVGLFAFGALIGAIGSGVGEDALHQFKEVPPALVIPTAAVLGGVAMVKFATSRIG